MTKEDWKRAEEALQHFFSTVNLKVDGYDITLHLERAGVYKNVIMIYINGSFKGCWLAEDCEERRRFYQRREHSLLSAKQKTDHKKLPKKMQKELADRYHNLCYETFSPQWTSFGSLKKHLTANNQQIELVSIT